MAGGCGPPRLVLVPARCCGRGDGHSYGSGDRAFVSAGGNRKRTAFPPPMRDGALKTGRSANTTGQRSPRAGWGWREATLRRGKGDGLCQGGGRQGRERKAPPSAAQGYRIWRSFRCSQEPLVNQTQAPGDIVTRVSSDRSRGRPDRVKGESPAVCHPLNSLAGSLLPPQHPARHFAQITAQSGG